MAPQRQLLLLLHRARNTSSTHAHTFNSIVRSQRVFSYHDPSPLKEGGSRFFSSASRYGGGKGTGHPEKSGGGSQKQGGAKPVAPTPASAKLNQSECEGETPPQPAQPPPKGSSSYLMIAGTLSLIAIGVLTLYPTDLRKLLNSGQKEDHSVSLPTKAAQKMEEHSVKIPTEATKKVEDLSEAPSNSVCVQENVKGQKVTDTKVNDYPKESVAYDNVYPLSTDTTNPKLGEEESTENARSEEPSSEINATKMENQDPVSSTVLDAAKDKGRFDSSKLPVDTEQPDIKEYADNGQGEPLQQGERPSIAEAYQLLTGDKNHNEASQTLGDESAEKGPTLDKSVRNAFDLLEIVHAAEERQAEKDAKLREESENKLKRTFQQELKDAQAKELMYADEASRLAKEIEEERERSAAALKRQQEIALERLNEELKLKQEEMMSKLKRTEVQAKTEIAAAIAREKASYLEDVKDVKQQLEGLHAALLTRSAEVSQRHTAHRLAVGTFALEDAMKTGAPIEKEVALILSSSGDSDIDPLLHAALSSLPESILTGGTRTPAQLHQKFESMRSALLELSLLPASGSGLLSHAAAKVVSKLKVSEGGHYSDGMEAIVSQVRKTLVDGKLADAADLLEKGVQGTEAEALVAEWVKSARDRAVMEQALSLLQAHATAVAVSLIQQQYIQ